MKISILTLFPRMFEGPFKYSIVKRAEEKKQIEISLVDIREFGIGSHKTVDDRPYGGGSGMILRVDVVKDALYAVVDKKLSGKEQKVVLLSASGEKYNQKTALNFSKLKHLILICGHYEGVDERVKKYIDYDISIGNFVLTGGEIPAMLIVDSVTRLIEGVLKEGVTDNESFSIGPDILEYPQYTRPETFDGQKIPEILKSGDHNKIEEWRKKNQRNI